jgi:hypothetical protein
MNIQTVAENLRNTIAGKVKHEAELEYALTLATMGERMALTATLAYLQVNIGELRRILQDVEKCVFDYDELKADLKEANGRVRQLEQRASDDSWITNPDRMGGGGWTADELDPNRGWK